jgi:hypothetical protein
MTILPSSASNYQYAFPSIVRLLLTQNTPAGLSGRSIRLTLRYYACLIDGLIARSKMIRDRAMPSGNGVATGNLLYLGKNLNDNDYLKKSKQTVLSASAILNQQGYFISRMLMTSIDPF